MGRTKRNDLITGQTEIPTGKYIGHIVAPALARFTKEGKFPKIASGANTNIVVDRVAGSVITPSINNAVPVVYACTQCLDRQGVDDGEKRQYGGEDRYKLQLARTAFLGVADKKELKISAAIMALTPATLAETSVLPKIWEAAEDLSDYQGELVCVMSKAQRRALRADTLIRDALKNTGMVPANVDPRFVSDQVLAAALNVSRVLVGESILWPADTLVVMVVPDGAVEPHQQIQATRTVVYVPDAATPTQLVECYEGYDDSRTLEYIDCEEWTDPIVLNADLIKVIDGSTASSGGSGSSAAASSSGSGSSSSGA